MHTRICYTILCVILLSTAAMAQQMPYSGKRHAFSRGGYNQVVKGYSHKGGLFRKNASPRVGKAKKKVAVF